jgi:hypothetical protein
LSSEIANVFVGGGTSQGLEAVGEVVGRHESLRGCFQIYKFVLFAASISRKGFRVEKVMYSSNLTDAQ